MAGRRPFHMLNTLRYARSCLRSNWSYWRRQRAWRRYVAEHPLHPDQLGLVVREGIGDHFAVSALAGALSRRHSAKVRLCGNPRYSFLKDLFPAVHDYAAIPRHLAAFDDIIDHQPTKGTYAQAFYPGNPTLVRAQGHHGFNMLDGYRCQLSLPDACPPDRPSPPSLPLVEQCSARLAARNIRPRQAVMLVMDARTLPASTAPLSLWAEVAAGLRALGLDPFVACGPDTPALPSVPAVDAELIDFRALATAAGSVCALRSGLADLLADLPGLKVVLYPDMPCGGGTVRGVFSIEAFGYGTPVKEITLGPSPHRALPDILAAFASARK